MVGPGVARVVLDGQVDDVAVAGAVENEARLRKPVSCGGRAARCGSVGRQRVRPHRRTGGCSACQGGRSDGPRGERCGGLRRKRRDEEKCGEQDARHMKAATALGEGYRTDRLLWAVCVAETAANFERGEMSFLQVGEY